MKSGRFEKRHWGEQLQRCPRLRGQWEARDGPRRDGQELLRDLAEEGAAASRPRDRGSSADAEGTRCSTLFPEEEAREHCPRGAGDGKGTKGQESERGERQLHVAAGS